MRLSEPDRRGGSLPVTAAIAGAADQGEFKGTEPSLSTHEFEKLFPCQAGVADQRSQETAAQFPMFRYRESAASRPNQDHVAAFHAIEGESDPRDYRHEVVSREKRESYHRYARTSMI